jgi:hypothetical protein
VPDDAGRANEDADEQVSADRSHRLLADEAQKRGHSQRAEDQADDAAEETDHRAACHRSRDVELLPPADRATGPEQVNAERDQQDPNHDEQRRPRKLSRDEPAEDSPHNRGRRHPPEHTPVDPAGAHLSDGSRCGRDARDADVRAGTGGGARGDEQQGRQTDVSEHEADEPTCERGHEAPCRDGGERERVQGHAG